MIMLFAKSFSSWPVFLFICVQYEVELTACRQQLQSLQSSYDDIAARLERERAANERLTSDYQRKLHDAEEQSEQHRLREEETKKEMQRLQQQSVPLQY
jgi:hypothetical protein